MPCAALRGCNAFACATSCVRRNPSTARCAALPGQLAPVLQSACIGTTDKSKQADVSAATATMEAALATKTTTPALDTSGSSSGGGSATSSSGSSTSSGSGGKTGLGLAGDVFASVSAGGTAQCNAAAAVGRSGACMWIGQTCSACEEPCIVKADKSSVVTKTRLAISRDMSCLMLSSMIVTEAVGGVAGSDSMPCPTRAQIEAQASVVASMRLYAANTEVQGARPGMRGAC